MSRSISVVPPVTGFENFLYAPAGQDGNGTSVSVLSVLARHDLDPWAEAATLSRLPEETAVNHLVTILGTLAYESSGSQEPACVAARLIALLPRRCDPPLLIRDRLGDFLSGEHLRFAVFGIFFFVIYTIFLLLGA